MLPLDKIIWLSREQHKKGEKSISVTINRILSEYQYLMEKFQEKEAAKAEPSYNEVRTEQIRRQIGQPINDQTKSKVELRRTKK